MLPLQVAGVGLAGVANETITMDMYRNCTAIEREWLTGTRDAAKQRAWCERMGVRYTKRARVSECEVWLDGRVCALLGGWRDPNVGAGLHLIAARGQAA